MFRLATSVWGVLLLVRATARAFVAIAVNTGKRVLNPMTAPTGLTETLEALDGGFGVAVRLRRAVGATSPGGKKVTLNEMLQSVSDGELKDSIRNLHTAIEKLVERRGIDFAGILDLIPTVVEAVLDFLQTLRAAIQDRKIDPSELLEGVSTKGLRPELQKAIDGAEKIPGELSGLDFGKMMQLMNRAMGWLPQLLADPA